MSLRDLLKGTVERDRAIIRDADRDDDAYAVKDAEKRRGSSPGRARSLQEMLAEQSKQMAATEERREREYKPLLREAILAVGGDPDAPAPRSPRTSVGVEAPIRSPKEAQGFSPARAGSRPVSAQAVPRPEAPPVVVRVERPLAVPQAPALDSTTRSEDDVSYLDSTQRPSANATPGHVSSPPTAARAHPSPTSYAAPRASPGPAPATAASTNTGGSSPSVPPRLSSASGRAVSPRSHGGVIYTPGNAPSLRDMLNEQTSRIADNERRFKEEHVPLRNAAFKIIEKQS